MSRPFGYDNAGKGRRSEGAGLSFYNRTGRLEIYVSCCVEFFLLLRIHFRSNGDVGVDDDENGEGNGDGGAGDDVGDVVGKGERSSVYVQYLGLETERGRVERRVEGG